MIIRGALRDLVPFLEFENVKNTKSLPWAFFKSRNAFQIELFRVTGSTFG